MSSLAKANFHLPSLSVIVARVSVFSTLALSTIPRFTTGSVVSSLLHAASTIVASINTEYNIFFMLIDCFSVLIQIKVLLPNVVAVTACQLIVL